MEAKHFSPERSRTLTQFAGAFDGCIVIYEDSVDMNVGRIVTQVTIENAADLSKALSCDALVDTGASFMVLPLEWKNRLGAFESSAEIEVEMATQETIRTEVCGPVRIQIQGFRPIFNEVVFVDMKPADGDFEPLIGYVVLEQSQASVDMLGQRLVPNKHMDLKLIIQNYFTEQVGFKAGGHGSTKYDPRNHTNLH